MTMRRLRRQEQMYLYLAHLNV
ncbi:hypothetical protein Golax_005259, partial [Gossypium laxum]|nr:hypothetical protein [Gossypium laxum]